MTYKEIIDILGEPNGLFGSGMQWPFYQLSDGTCVILYVGSDKSSELYNIIIVDSGGRVFELKESKEDS